MYALVEDNTIIKTYNNPKGMTIGGVQYPQNIHGLWSEAELNAIGIYTVIEDNTNKRDENWYNNTNQTLAFAGGVVTASYGTATGKVIATTYWTQQDSDDELLPINKSIGDIKVKGLKLIKKELFDRQAAGRLSKYDWYIIRNTEASTAIPSAITDYRTAVRAKCNSMQAQVDGAADVDALAALFTHTEQEDGSITSPLGKWPVDPNEE